MTRVTVAIKTYPSLSLIAFERVNCAIDSQMSLARASPSKQVEQEPIKSRCLSKDRNAAPISYINELIL